MTKVLLIQPPIEDFYRTKFREYPLGLLYLASSLENSSYNTTILDARICKKPKKITIPSDFEHLTPFKSFFHFGMLYEDIGLYAEKIKPDYTIINSMFTPYVDGVIKTGEAIKKCFSQTKIIVGGHHATVDSSSLIKNSTIDCIVKGEGEEIISEILKNGVTSSIYPSDEKTYCIKNLDNLSLPARHLIPATTYTFGKKNYTMLLTSRGCPYKCSFCSIHALHGHIYREHSIDYTLNEINEIINKHKIQIIDLQDDNLLFNSERIKILFEKIISKYGFNAPEFLASNGLNVAHIDNELLNLMKQVGFRKLDIAIASADTSFRKKLNRPETLHHYEKILNLANKLGISVTTYIILGIPTQPLKEMRETIDYLKTKPTLISPSIFYNVPGMPIYNKMKKYEYNSKHISRRSSSFNNHGIDFVRQDIINLFEEIRQYNLGKKNC